MGNSFFFNFKSNLMIYAKCVCTCSNSIERDTWLDNHERASTFDFDRWQLQ